jgi:hypothetical protein
MNNDAPLVTRLESQSSASQRTSAVGLPDDLLRDSARRLRFIALFYAGGFLLATVAELSLDATSLLVALAFPMRLS